jgi:capsule polysaccharide export protein KpsE/RkpR
MANKVEAWKKLANSLSNDACKEMDRFAAEIKEAEKRYNQSQERLVNMFDYIGGVLSCEKLTSEEKDKILDLHKAIRDKIRKKSAVLAGCALLSTGVQYGKDDVMVTFDIQWEDKVLQNIKTI